MDLPKLLRTISELIAAQRYDEAADACQQLITLAPESAHAHITMGDIRVGQERYAEAIDAYREAIALKPKQVEEVRRKLDEAIDLLAMQKAEPPPPEAPPEPASLLPVAQDNAPALPPLVPLFPVTNTPAAQGPAQPESPPAPTPLFPVTNTMPVAVADPPAGTAGDMPMPATVTVAGAPERPPLPVYDEEESLLHNDFLTPQRMRLIIIVAIIVIILTLVINNAPWKWHHRPTHVKPVPIPLDEEPKLPPLLPNANPNMPAPQGN